MMPGGASAARGYPRSYPPPLAQNVDGVTGRRRCSKPLARYGAWWWRARWRLAVGFARQVVVPQTDGVESTESDVSAPSIIEGRPWTIMQVSTCHWNTRACALSRRVA